MIILVSFGVGATFLGIDELWAGTDTPYERVAPARPIAVFLQQLVGLESWSTGFPLVGAILAITLIILSFKIRHFWCRICPAGAMMSFINRKSLVNIMKDGEKCTKCRVCLRACPMDIEEIYEEKEKDNVTNPVCIHCYRCVELCPEEGCLSVTFMNKPILKSKYPYTSKK
jgi:ferredoxin